MSTARLNWIDYARGMAITLVCYRHVYEGSKEAGIPVKDYHFLEYINISLYSFRMPLFFIISGLFIMRSLQKRGLKQYIEGRARTILYPYFLWGMLQLTLQMFFTKYTNAHPTPASYLDLFYQPRECAQFWYLYALFNVSVLYSFTKYFLRLSAIHNMVLGIIFFYLSALIYQQDIRTGFVFDILHYYVFFSIGDFVSSYFLDEKKQQHFGSAKNLLLILIPFGAGQTYFLLENLRHSTPKFMHVEFYQPFVFFLIALTGCLFAINLSFYLQKKNALKWLAVLGRHSLYIYVAHVIVFAFTRIVLSQFLGIQNVALILLSGMASGLLVPVLLYKLASHWNLRWIFTLEKKDAKENRTPVRSHTVPGSQGVKS
jgi:fucose 4-O-acetylase-like acetyltransferase